jgi:N-ethylmaleimide reductase
MSDSTSNLLSKTKLGNITLSNRVVMAPMTRCRAINNIPGDLIAEYYEQRSSAGLLITEGTAPSLHGLGYARIPGIYSQAQIDGWKKVTDAVHAKDGKIFLQIMHTGRVSHSVNMPEGAKILAPSRVNADGDMWTDALGMQKTEEPSEMTAEEIRESIGEFVQSARNAITAGFDGIEFHAANGYLFEQFLNPHSNQRTDSYGGSIVKRARFLLEVVKESGEAIGFDRIGVRLSPYNTYNSMVPYDETSETYQYLATELNKLNIVYLHLVAHAPRGTEEGRELLKSIRSTFKNAIILNGGYTKETAGEAISNNEADLISFGSSFIANPDLLYRIKQNIGWATPDATTFFTADEKGFVDYAVAG